MYHGFFNEEGANEMKHLTSLVLLGIVILALLADTISETLTTFILH